MPNTEAASTQAAYFNSYYCWGDHNKTFIILTIIINMEGLYLYMQITIIATTGTFISLVNKQLISSWVKISIKQQRNIPMVV